MASNQGHASYYVPESTRFPFFAAMGLGLIVLGAGGLLNDMKAGGFEHIVKSVCEFAVLIMNQEPKIGIGFL